MGACCSNTPENQEILTNAENKTKTYAVHSKFDENEITETPSKETPSKNSQNGHLTYNHDETVKRSLNKEIGEPNRKEASPVIEHKPEEEEEEEYENSSAMKRAREPEINHFPLDYETGKLNEIPKTLRVGESKLKAHKEQFSYEPQDDQDRNLPKGAPYRIPSTGDIYEGQWKNQLPHGRGVLYTLQGDVFEGEWYQGRKQGRGRMLYKNGEVYEGWFSSDKRNGSGTYHGWGKEIWKDGSVYEGYYRAGVKEGKGVFNSEIGVYDGQFADNKRHGMGELKFKNGDSYCGNWRQDKMDGKGEFCWADGSSYVGEYENDVKQGKGVFLWSDGRKFEGKWKNGVQEGEGLMGRDGNMRKGVWKDGKRVKWMDEEENKNSL